MKKIVVFVVLIFSAFSVPAQKMPSDYFEEAEQFYEEKEYGKALQAYQYIVEHYPRNDLYPRSYYNMGYLFYTEKKYKYAIPVFQNILKSDFNEKEASGGGIMEDPYANYRNRSSELLSEIYYEQKMYDSSLYYFALSDTAYPYLHFCGNEIADNNVFKALRYASIYKHLKQPEQAVHKLLPAVFITLADNSAVLTELKKLLAGRQGLKSQLDESIANMYPKEFTQGKRTYRRYYFRYLDTEILVPGGYEDEKSKFDPQKGREEISNSEFYKMIGAL